MKRCKKSWRHTTQWCIREIWIFFFFFYIPLTLHSPTGMAGSSPRLTNTCAPTTTAASTKVQNKPSARRQGKPYDSANRTSEIHWKKSHLNWAANHVNITNTMGWRRVYQTPWAPLNISPDHNTRSTLYPRPDAPAVTATSWMPKPGALSFPTPLIPCSLSQRNIL